jgi:hypothetical protein
MFVRSRSKAHLADPDIAQRAASMAFERVREHWSTCDSCRGAAASSSSLWCAEGLELMKRGIAEDAHWNTCASCKEAQERVQSGQCARGRELEKDYRALVRRLAGA